MERNTASEHNAQKKQSRWGFRGKTVWDWLQLLIVPLALVLIGLAFSMQQDARQQRIEDQRAEAERELAEQRAQDEALQAYLDQMGNLLLEKNLRESEEDSEVRTLARARTLAVLASLGSDLESGQPRKGTVIEFLYEASLIDKDNPVIDLSDADLREAELSVEFMEDVDLSGADLRGANLRYSDLWYANLAVADLSGADLTEANLHHADLWGINLSGADLRGANLNHVRRVDADTIVEQAKSIEGAILPSD